MTTPRNIFPDIGPFKLTDAGKPRILPDAFWLLINSIARAALGATVVPGLGVEWRNRLEEYTQRNGKFTKFESVYSPVAPPPVSWNYTCQNCWAFEAETRTCRWVQEEGFPNPGQIHPAGWCAVWMPREGDPPLSWTRQLPYFVQTGPPAFP